MPSGPQREKLEKKLQSMEEKVSQMQAIKQQQAAESGAGKPKPGLASNFNHLAPLASILMEAQEEDSSSEED